MSPKGRRRPTIAPTAGRDAIVLALAVGLALLPLVPVYGVRAVLPAAIGGVVLGAATAVIAARRAWGVLATCVAVLGLYLVFGAALAAPATALAGVVPTLGSFVTLLSGAISVWKEVLTLEPELGGAADVLVAPYLLGLVGSASAVSLAARARRRVGAWATVIPLGVLGVSLLLGTKQYVQPLAAGAVVVISVLVWAAWRAGSLAPRRLVALTVMAVTVAAGGVVGGPLLMADAHPRLVLRDEVVPPFNPLDHPSPLSAFRSFVKQWRDTTLFTVSGLPEGTAVRLATMDAFDGVVWNVAGSEQAEGSGTFRRVGDTIDASVEGTDAHIEFEVADLPMVWLPTVGYAQQFSFTGPDAQELAADLRYNDATGTAVLAEGAPSGAQWSVDVVVPDVPSDSALQNATAGSARLPEPRNVPDAVVMYAAQAAGTASSPILIAQGLESGLADLGWFSHGVAASDYPSMSGHGADRITTLLTGDLMVGDGEQYASAMALMARGMGLPSRVVLGFIPDGKDSGETIAVTGDDIQAWVEIQFAGHGWVSFYPTPDESRTPQADTPQEKAGEEPQVRQPPPPLPETVDPPEDDTEQPQTRESADDPLAADSWGQVLLVGASVGVPLLILVGPVLVIAFMKRHRRRRRRTAEDPVARVVGGWDELLDLARDLRHPAPAVATRRETAVHFAEVFAARSAKRSGGVGETKAPGLGGAVAGLAAGADAVVFGPGQPVDDQIDLYWKQVDVARSAMRSAVSGVQRWRSWWATASLRARRAAGRRSRKRNHVDRHPRG